MHYSINWGRGLSLLINLHPFHHNIINNNYAKTSKKILGEVWENTKFNLRVLTNLTATDRWVFKHYNKLSDLVHFF